MDVIQGFEEFNFNLLFEPAKAVNEKYLEEWFKVADAFCVANPIRPQEVAPKDVVCCYCWDTGLCAECLGRYGPMCPAECKDGTCHCQKNSEPKII